MIEQSLQAICDAIQEDVGGRGLRTDPNSNLITATLGDFPAACRSVADTPKAAVAIVTGFYIPHAQPPSGETDGPLGALFLARAFTELGIGVRLATDKFCTRALELGLAECKLTRSVPLITLPSPEDPLSLDSSKTEYHKLFVQEVGPITHLIALERVGPNHTPRTLQLQYGPDEAILQAFAQEVPCSHQQRCHTMRGEDITANLSPAHWLFGGFNVFSGCGLPTTIGIGDGGNEIGMGKIPWDIIRRNIPNGGLVACRVPTDYLIVSGVSNWGAYGLAAGVSLLHGAKLPSELFDPERERELLRVMVERGPLVDGVSGQATLSVDGLPFERYAETLRRIGELVV